jgi:hypothetical protein
LVFYYYFPTKWGGGIIFNGYFSADNTTNLVTGFYDYTNIGVDTLITIGNPLVTDTLKQTDTGFNKLLYPNTQNIHNEFDNAYRPSWVNFDDYGLTISNIANFNLPPPDNYPLLSGYFYELYAPRGGQTSTTGFVGVSNFSGSIFNLYNTNVNIQPMSGPPSPVPCFLECSKILTDKGYKPIQDLRKGDLVKTLKHDYKAIDMIGKREIYHPALQERIKDQLYKCSQSEYTEIFEPLIITGCHSILVDSFTSEEQKQKVIEVNDKIYVTDNKYRLPACADPCASIYETHGTYTIYHLALENDDYYMNYGIYANGLLVETCSKRYLKELSNMTLIE